MSTLDALKQIGDNSKDLLNNLKTQQDKSPVSELTKFFENLLEDQQKEMASLKDQIKALNDKASKLAKDSEELVTINTYVDEKLRDSNRSIPLVNNSQPTTVEKTKYLVASQETELKEMQAELATTKRTLKHTDNAYTHGIYFHMFQHLNSEDQQRVNAFIERFNTYIREIPYRTYSKVELLTHAFSSTDYYTQEFALLPEVSAKDMDQEECNKRILAMQEKAWGNMIQKLTAINRYYFTNNKMSIPV